MLAVINCTSVYTYEVDDQETALDEIKAQLDQKITLLENTVGVITCHTEFIGTGVLKYISENLPFDVAGITTATQAVNGESGELMLAIFVITSDDAQFRTGVTTCLNEDIPGPTKAAYDKAAAGMTELPKLALVFPPLILKYAGDSYVDVWGGIIPNTPIFGAIAIDDTVSFSGSETICNGVTSKTAMSFIVCYGNITPRFLVGALPEDNIMPYKGEITSSDGPFVHEINNINAYKYCESLGFANNGAPTDSFLFVPFMIDLRKRSDYDGIPVMRGLSAFTEDGTAIFRGNVDKNSVFTLSSLTFDDVISTALNEIDKINNMMDVNGVLFFPCIIHRMVLGTNPLLESEKFKENLKPEIPFMLGYAGGEICPTSVREGIPANRFHNYSLITLII